jgi:hypothetical protein
MRAELIFLIALVLAGNALGGQQKLDISGQKLEASSVPRIEFSVPIFDFGRMESGLPIKHDFVFTNTGGRTLEIIAVRPGCGCTTTGAWDKHVEPGRSGTIPVQFNSAPFSGALSKPITVICNDPERTNITLQIKGTLWRPIEVTPGFVTFNTTIENPSNETQLVRIVSNLDAPLTLSEPVLSNNSFQTSLKLLTPGKEYELSITPALPLAGTVTTQIILKTSSTKKPLLTIPAFLTVRPVLTANPSQISLPAGPLAANFHAEVTIENSGTNPVTLSEPAIGLPNIDLQLRETKPGRQFMVTATFPAGFQGGLGQKMAVSLKTSHPGFPLFNVPVWQMPSPQDAAPASGEPAISLK